METKSKSSADTLEIPYAELGHLKKRLKRTKKFGKFKHGPLSSIPASTFETSSVLRLTSISLVRIFLLLPYITYLTGMGSFFMWYLVVSIMSLVKTAALVRKDKR